MLKLTIKTFMHSPLHVSVHLDHLQGAYGDPSQSYTFLELSVTYIVKSFALLGQHVFQAVVLLRHTLHGTRYTQQPETLCPNNAKLLTMYFTDNSKKM
jgi:hypothetical protein